MRHNPVHNTPLMLGAMALALGLFYRGGVLPAIGLGLLIYGVLAMLRPELALLFVPLTAPLYLMPVLIPGLSASGEFLQPIHEVVMLLVPCATAANWIGRRLFGRAEPQKSLSVFRAQNLASIVWTYAPHGLLLLASLIAILPPVLDRGAALREFRRLIVEPLIFYGLLRYHMTYAHQDTSARELAGAGFIKWMTAAFILSGTSVALLGLLQFVGLDLVGFIAPKRIPGGIIDANVVDAGGLRRVTSVYGHPNNLGLYLGRVWPLAAALVAAPLALGQRDRGRRDIPWFYALAALLCLAGLLVSFSRGAWMGAVAALAVLVLWAADIHQAARAAGDIRPPMVGRRWLTSARAPWLIALAATLAAVGGLALMLRGDPTAGSTSARLLLWREAVALIRQHPFGLGLDQFYFYHNPEFGHSQIDPSLIGTSEQYAAHPHNLFLDIWLRLGPLGLAAVAWLLVRFFRSGIRRATQLTGDPRCAGALAAMSAALIHGLVDNFYFFPDLAVAFWLLIALVDVSEAKRH